MFTQADFNDPDIFRKIKSYFCGENQQEYHEQVQQFVAERETAGQPWTE